MIVNYSAKYTSTYNALLLEICKVVAHQHYKDCTTGARQVRKKEGVIL